LKEEALDRTVWRTGFGKGNWPVVKQTTEWMKKTLICLTTSNSASPIGCRTLFICQSSDSKRGSQFCSGEKLFRLASYRPTSQYSVLWEFGIWNVRSTSRYLLQAYHKYNVVVYILSIKLFLPLLTRKFHCVTSQLYMPNFT
jgi:hypothetical protein